MCRYIYIFCFWWWAWAWWLELLVLSVQGRSQSMNLGNGTWICCWICPGHLSFILLTLIISKCVCTKRKYPGDCTDEWHGFQWGAEGSPRLFHCRTWTFRCNHTHLYKIVKYGTIKMRKAHEWSTQWMENPSGSIRSRCKQCCPRTSAMFLNGKIVLKSLQNVALMFFTLLQSKHSVRV